MISVYQPPNGHSSTTVMFGRMPKNDNVSTGWRYLSRALFASERWSLLTTALSFARSAPEVSVTDADEARDGAAVSAMVSPIASRHAAKPRILDRIMSGTPPCYRG